MKQNNEVLATWNVAAQYWEKHRETIRTMFAPITDALIAEAEIEAGQRVLDVATGPGEPTLSIAVVVGPGGSVVGVDPIQEMIAASVRAANARGLNNVRFEVASGDRLPLESGSFDAAVCRFGIMFFPSPIDGIKEMLRVLKPGRKLALAVWGFPTNNAFHYALANVIDPYVAPEALPPDAPDAFRFAAPGKLLDIVTQAGAAAPSERHLRFKIEAPLSIEDFWSLRQQMSEKLRKRLATLPPEKFAALEQEVLKGLGQYSTPQGLSFPSEVLIVSGTKA